MREDNSAYRNSRLPVEKRVADLLGRMTLDEKIAQIGGVWSTGLIAKGRFSEEQARTALRHGTGHVTRIGGATTLRPREIAAVANGIQKFLLEQTRLGIPAIIHEESCAGFLARDATCFPQAIGLASTWEPRLIEEMAGVIRAQMRAVGTHQALAPVLDVARDPRWGRTEETFGEDPYLIAQMGIAYVRGLQGDDLSRGVVATGKHFLGYAASEGGMNWAPAHIPRRELLEVYAAPFEAVIREANLASMMNAYSEIDGVPLGASKELLGDLLRGELGFGGVVVSDYFTVQTLFSYHHVTEDPAGAASLALEAGIDVELPALDCYGAPLRGAIERGQVEPALLDAAVSRVLRMKLELGLFDNPYVDEGKAAEIFDTVEQRALAGEIARKSIVLLKNKGDLLPLDRELGCIAVVGPCADSIRLLQGDYHYPAHLEIMFGPVREDDMSPRPGSKATSDLGQCFVRMVSVLEGITAKVAPETKVVHAAGCEIVGGDTEGIASAVTAARQADVVVVVVGDRSGLVDGCTSGESVDRCDLGLPGHQQALVEAVVSTRKPVVVVLINGRPMAVPWIAEQVPAIIEAWQPGEEGGTAVAEVLFGDYNPGGKLPISFPGTVGQVPVYYNHKPSGGRSQWKGDYADGSAKPLFPFGHGLSFTRFEYAGLEIAPVRVHASDTVSICAQVKNVGNRAGDEVVQIYAHDVVASVSRPVKELKSLARVALAPGEQRRVAFDLAVSQLAFYDREMGFVVEPGTIEVMIGSSSEDIRLTGAFEIVGEVTEVRDMRRSGAPVAGIDRL